MQRTWWKESVVYQIYPRSFYDSNGDGIGDLRGIIQKIDYLAMLGIDVVWLSPVYQSPNDDNGYDIRDYQDIMDEFGTLADWEELLAGLHARGIRLVMDLVVNHTSDEHAWFVESRKSKDNPYRDYYIWRPGRDGGEPNNWESFFGGSAWQRDDATGEYYLHLFSKKQPDLNWENRAVRDAVYEMMRWWLDKGINGFRMDVITMISKTPGLPDAPVLRESRYQPGNAHFIQGPRLLEFLTEMRREVLGRYDVLAVGEAVAATPEHAVLLTDAASGPLNMLFQFEHVALDMDRTSGSKWSPAPWRLIDLKRVMSRWQAALAGRGWNSLYLANHDQPRSVSRFGEDGVHRVAAAKLLATMLHTLQGTPFVYQGEEIGMTNVAFPSIDDYRDIETLNIYHELVDGRGMAPADAMALIHSRSRDNARTPMQWDDGPNAGFTSGSPWLQPNPNYRRINVEQALADPHSVLHYYRRLIGLRRDNPILVYGDYRLLLDDHDEIFAYVRSMDDTRLLVVLNFGAGSPTFALPADIPAEHLELLLSNLPDSTGDDARNMPLRPFEARIYRVR